MIFTCFGERTVVANKRFRITHHKTNHLTVVDGKSVEVDDTAINV